MSTLPFETFIFGDGQATVVVFYDDVALRLVRVDYTIVSGTLVASVTNNKSGAVRTFTSSTDGSLSLPTGKQFPLAEETNDAGEVVVTHGDLGVTVHWQP